MNMRIELLQHGHKMKGRKELCCPRYCFGNASYINQRVIFLLINGIMLK